jgi:DNA helicase-2/ATP-dependent DNA helicase PcrA
VKHFSRLKDEDISPDEYLKYAKSLKKRKKSGGAGSGFAGKSMSEEEAAEAARILELAKVYGTYNQLLLDNNALDFGDLILYTLRLLKERPAILKQYQKQFQYVLVDEFQDTNWAQYELIKRLAAPRNNLTVVGDDDQSIYKFRGASVSNIIAFRRDYTDAKVVVLTKNYRSKQAILDLAYKFIQHNNPDRLESTGEVGDLKICKRLDARRPGDASVEVMHVETQELEARAVADKIEELKKVNAELSWESFSVLVRANDQAEIYIREFEQRGMPYVFLAARGLFRKPIILDLLAYLRVLDDHHHGAAMYRVMTMSVLGLDHGDITQINSIAHKKAWSIYEALENIDQVQVKDETRKRVRELLLLLKKHVELAHSKSVFEVLLQAITDLGVLQQLTAEDSSSNKELVGYIQQLFKTITIFQQGEEPPTVRTYLRYVDHIRESGDAGSLERDLESGPEAIRIMTIHAAKGLEFPYVFVGQVVEQRFPSMDRPDAIPVPDPLIRETLPQGDAHLQEERRLMYVAATRARDGLFFTLAEDYGGVRRKRPSAFMYELGLMTPPTKAEKKPALPAGRVLHPAPAENVSRPAVNKPEQSFSFTKLSTYNTCPWQYRYAFVLQVPRRGSHALSYGSTIHKTLQRFFSLWQERAHDKKATGELVSAEELHSIYEHMFIDEWYPSKKMKEEYRAKGRVALTNWYAATTKDMPDVLRMEQVFNLKIDSFTVTGAIDRIDKIGGDENKPVVRIIDYKTGKYREKFETEDRHQLLIYALAVQEPHIMGADVSELTYYFIDEGKTATLAVRPQDEAATQKWIKETVAEIQSGDFAATPGRHCQFCEFRDICAFRQG